MFLSGVAFFFLTLLGIRRMIVSAIPPELYAAVAAGIGIFIALIGFRNAGIIVPNAVTTVALGDLRAPNTLLSLFGLLLMAALLVRRIRAAMLIGVLATTAAGVALRTRAMEAAPYNFADLTSAAFRLDIPGALRLGAFEIVFVFLFVDLFDNVGTLVGVGKKAGLFNEANEIPRLNRILYSDATATLAGSLAGTSHRRQLHRKRGRRCRRREKRRPRRRYRPALSAGALHRPFHRSRSVRRHRPRAHPGRFHDDVARL